MSNEITKSTAAALRTLGVPSSVVSTGISTWSGSAALHGFGLTVDIPNPMVARARVAKQDRPPRGVPR